MFTRTKKNQVDMPGILGLLGQALKLEYSLIFQYPRFAALIPDEEIRPLVLALGTASVSHADIVSKTMTRLGGTPMWSIDPLPVELNMVKIFEIQLEKEKLALGLHSQCAELVPDPSLRNEFSQLAKEEESHIRTCEKVIFMLKQRG